MKQNLIIPVLLAFLLLTNIYAQKKIPVLTGKVKISISEGTFECDLTLSDIPRIKDYFIRLNSGMNILHIRSKKPDDFLINYSKSCKDSLSTGESNAYYFGENSGKGKFLPESIEFKYVGKYPVVKDTIDNYCRKDWKGNIAFNQYSVRSDGLQSAWYPVLYDVTNDKVYEKVKYDIELICPDCSVLYVNGSAPVKSHSYNFKSDTPQELALFCGNYNFSKYKDTFFLNSGLTEAQIQNFGKLIESYKSFYAQNLKIPFDQSVCFIQTTPVSKNDAWMFVSYPTIMSIGWHNGLKSIVEPKYQNLFRPFIAHELGHYYFGNYKIFNSPLGDMMKEGFAEYMSMILTRNLIGEDVYEKKLNRKIKILGNFNAKPFSKIKTDSEYNNRELYVYNFAPIIFLAIEKEIGEKTMWKWLNAILTTPTNFTDYDFLISTLRQTLNDDKKFNHLKTNFFESNKSLENAIDKLKRK